mmetsp:Transcript_31424/g.55312  ORF Transcript_31424/g.55312 Transcript_31424/m.55312 type:complete len:365 (+) Transcript_31424:67-1161(+)
MPYAAALRRLVAAGLGGGALAWKASHSLAEEKGKGESAASFGSDVYAVYRPEGAGDGTRVLLAADYEDMIEDFRRKTCRLVILGETHGDRVAHFLEKRVFDDLASSTPKCGLSMEMFESDKQQVLNEYLRGLIPESSMLKDCRAWANYRRDYRPIVEAAKNQGLPVFAANAPGRYVGLVNRSGQEALLALGEDGRALLPPLPFRMPSEALRWKVFDFMNAQKYNSNSSQPACPAQAQAEEVNPALSRMVEAQSLWDASMAWTLAELLKAGECSKVVHLCGRFHVEHGLGIPEHLEGYLRSNHCESTLASFDRNDSSAAFRSVAKTAVFVPAEFSADGRPSIDLDALAYSADWVVLTDASKSTLL